MGAIEEIGRDIKIFSQANHYAVSIAICGNKTHIGFSGEYLITDKEVMEAWENFGQNRKSPQIPIFPELKIAINSLQAQRTKIYNRYCTDLSPHKIVPGEELSNFRTAAMSLIKKGKEKRDRLIEAQPRAKQDWLEGKIVPWAYARYEDPEKAEAMVKKLGSAFPSQDYLLEKFKVAVEVFEVDYIREAIAPSVVRIDRKAEVLKENQKAESEAIAYRDFLEEQRQASRDSVACLMDRLKQKTLVELYAIAQKLFNRGKASKKSRADLEQVIFSLQILSEFYPSLKALCTRAEELRLASNTALRIESDKILTELENLDA